MRYRPHVLAVLLFLAPVVARAQEVAKPTLDALGVSSATSQRLVLPQGLPASFSVRIGLGGHRQILDLDRYDVRARAFRLLVQDSAGIHAVPTPRSVTYRGTVRGLADSVVTASLMDRQMRATVRLDDRHTWIIQPANTIDARQDARTHVCFQTSAIKRLPGHCAKLPTKAQVSNSGARSGGVLPQAVVLAELAVDADLAYFKRNGSSVTATANRITTIINGVDAIYRRDVQIAIKLSSILVRTTATYKESDPMRLLPEFRQRWNQSHGSIQRDLAHLFTGKGTFTGLLGFAYLGTVCNLRWAFGVSKAYHTNLAVNVGLVAHQIAHNWDALHCDSTQPCNLMCSTLGGCNRNLTSFGKASKAVILRFKSTRKCLDDARPPRLTAITPKQAPAFGGPRITLTGSVMKGVTEVRVGTVRIQGGFSKSDTSVSFSLPKPDALGAQSVSVKSPAGRSNSLTLRIVETRPPALRAPGTGLGGFPIRYTFGGAAKAPWVLLVAASNRTLRFMGFDVLRGGFPLAAGALDRVGFGSFGVTVPRGVRGIVWSQLTVFGKTGFDGASKLHSTFFF